MNKLFSSYHADRYLWPENELRKTYIITIALTLLFSILTTYFAYEKGDDFAFTIGWISWIFLIPAFFFPLILHPQDTFKIYFFSVLVPLSILCFMYGPKLGLDYTYWFLVLASYLILEFKWFLMHLVFALILYFSPLIFFESIYSSREMWIHPVNYYLWLTATLSGMAFTIIMYRIRQTELLRKNQILLNQVEQNLINLQEKQQEVLSKNEELESLTYFLAHNIKSPVRSINTFLYLVEKNQPSLTASLQEQFSFAKMSVSHINFLIEDVVNYFNILNQKKTFHVNINDSLQAIEKELSEKYQFKLEYQQFKHGVKCNNRKVFHLFKNIIENGLIYNSKEHKYVTLDYELNKQWLEVKIKDNGDGIEQEYFDEIFQIFRRLVNHNSIEGSGIGLNLSKRIIEEMSGKITVDSIVHEGTEFNLLFPRSIVFNL